MPEYYSLYQAAELFDVNWETVRREIKRGHLPAFKFGKQWRIPKADLIAYMRSRRFVPAEDGRTMIRKEL